MNGKTTFHADKKKLRKGKGKAGDFSKGPKPDDVCCYCKGTSHWANKCPHHEEDEKAKQGKGRSTNLAIGNLRDLGTHELGQVYMVSSGSTCTAKVLLDCGASAHMFCDRKFFCSYKMMADSETISVGDTWNIPVARTGLVALCCQLPDGIWTVILHGVWHVPMLAANLVSLGTLQRSGANHHSHENEIMVTL